MKLLHKIEQYFLNYKPAAKIFLVSIVLGISFLPVPTGNFTLCPFKLITGMPCPGCGLGQSFICISHGSLNEAVNIHLFGPVIYFFFLFILLSSLSELVTGKKISLIPKLYRYKIYYTFAFALCFYHLYRISKIIFENQTISYLQNSVFYLLYIKILNVV